MKRWCQNFLLDLLGGSFYAIGVCVFAKESSFSTGGLTGISLIIHYLLDAPIGLMSLLLNIVLACLCYQLVGKQFLYKTMRSIVICSMFVDLVFCHFPAYSGSPLLASLYTGIFFGAGVGIFYLRGSSTGGTDFLTVAIKVTRPHLSIGMVSMFVNGAVVLLGWGVYGNIDATLYGLINVAAESLVINRILGGFSTEKLLLIITTQGEAIAGCIAEKNDRGSTMCHAIGTYTGEERQLLLCACSKMEVHSIRMAIYHIDKKAFVMVTDTSHIFGEGFLDPQDLNISVS